MKLKRRACYLTNRQSEEKRNESGSHRIYRLGLGLGDVDCTVLVWATRVLEAALTRGVGEAGQR